MRADAYRLSVDTPSPREDRILEKLVSGLERNKDYADERTRSVVNAVLAALLRFFVHRLDSTRANDPGSFYLFASTERLNPFAPPGTSPPPAKEAAPAAPAGAKAASKKTTKPKVEKPAKATPERDQFERNLQLDFANFLRASLGGAVHLERSDVAGGRADIVVDHLAVRLVIEVKREDDDASHEGLRARYGAQASEYSNTNARIGFLLVLDRSRKDGTSGDIEEKFSVQTITKTGDKEPRMLVFAVMPGKRKRPSELQLGE
ncbi:hypothetical protein [Pseudoroseomonas ludipueritiae]|uniref:hypothetical protein n=1 Tax=Pseudoroseomonas ludipueritiae TaxID=198093 RepID=UPI00362B0A72